MASKRSREGQRTTSARAVGEGRRAAAVPGGRAGAKAAGTTSGARGGAGGAAGGRGPSPPRARTTPAGPPGEAVGSESEYGRFLAAARALPAGEVQRLAVDPAVAYHNVAIGVDAVLVREDLVRRLPDVDVDELRALPALCLGLSFAALQVDREGRSDGQTRAILREAFALRRSLLAGAEALAAAGLVPPAAVAKIRAGRGPFDLADDCVALAALYRKHAPALRGKTAVTAAEARRAAELGTELRTRLKPARARRSGAEPGAEPGAAEAEMRDRFWTLLARGHDKLWRAGAFVFGRRDVDARVPPLGSQPGRRGARPPAGLSPTARGDGGGAAAGG